MSDNPHPKNYTLRLDFDLDQISTALRFNILHGNEPTIQKTGKAAGGYVVRPQDTLGIEIFGSFDPEKLTADQIFIKDLIMVCMPANCASQSNLSPFILDSAGFVLQQWYLAKTVEEITHTFAQSEGDAKVGTALFLPGVGTGPERESDVQPVPQTPLQVIAQDGQWQISGYLSVLVKTEKPHCRVFSFDPTVIIEIGIGIDRLRSSSGSRPHR